MDSERAGGYTRLIRVGNLFAGAMIGAAAALLLAPASGEETRNSLQEHIRGTFGDMHDQALEYTESLKGFFARRSILLRNFGTRRVLM